MALIDTLEAKLRLDVSEFERGVRQAQGGMKDLGTATDTTEAKQARFRAGLKDVSSEALGAAGPVGGLASKLMGAGGLAAAGLAAGVAVTGLGAALKVGIAEIQEAEQAAAKLTAVFNGNAAAIGRMMALADQVAQATPFFEGDQVQQGLATLKLFDLTEQQMRDLLPVMTNVATVMGQDMQTAAQQLGLATMGNTRGLKALGIELKEGASAQEVFNAYMAKGATFAEGAAQMNLGLSGALAGAGKSSKDLGEALARVAEPAIKASAAAWTTLAGQITSFISEPKELEIKIKVSGDPAMGGDALAGLLDPAKFADQMFGSTRNMSYQEMGAGKLSDWTADALKAMDDETATIIKARETAAKERRSKLEAAAKKQREEDAKLPDRLAAGAKSNRGALTSILEGQMNRDLKTNANFGGGIAGEQSIVASMLGADAIKFLPEFKAKLEGMRDDLAQNAKVKNEQAALDLDALERRGREIEEKNRLSLETAITDIYTKRDAAHLKAAEEAGKKQIELAAQAVSMLGGAVAGAVRGQGLNVGGILAGVGGMAGTALGGPVGGAVGGAAGEVVGAIVESFSAKADAEKLAADSFKESALQMQAAADRQREAADKALMAQTQGLENKIAMAKINLDEKSGKMTGKQADIARLGVQFGLDWKQLFEGSGLLAPKGGPPAMNGRSVQGLAGLANQKVVGAVAAVTGNDLAGMVLPKGTVITPELRKQFDSTVDVKPPDSSPLAKGLSLSSAMAAVNSAQTAANAQAKVGAESVPLLDKLFDLFRELIEVSDRGTERNPLIIRTPQGADYAFAPRSFFFRAGGSGTTSHRPPPNVGRRGA